MSYATIESALDTIVKTVSGYSASNVTKNDDRVLATGQNKAIILRPGAFSRENLPPGIVNTNWQIVLELYIPYRGEVVNFADTIRTERQAIIDKIDTKPTLGKTAGVLLSFVESGEEPELWQIGTNYFWRQIMRVTVRETVTVSYDEP